MKITYIFLFLIITGVILTSCDQVNSPSLTEEKTVTVTSIDGVIPPVYGEIPAEVISETDQFSGTISWNISESTFAENTVYTETIELTAKPGFTLIGLSENIFTLEGASSVTNTSDSGVIVAVFPSTGVAPVPLSVIDLEKILGIKAPKYLYTPDRTITETDQYTGTVSWNPAHSLFGENTYYTAKIELKAEEGYTFDGLGADFFKLDGATRVSNSVDSGIIEVEFPLSSYKIGDIGPSGVGIVFYVTNHGRNGYEVAPEDQAKKGAWSNVINEYVIGNTWLPEEIGSGLTNTNAIIAQENHIYSAAQICRDYRLLEEGDWFLPSKDELCIFALYVLFKLSCF